MLFLVLASRSSGRFPPGEARKLRLVAGKGPEWGQHGNEAGTGGWRQEAWEQSGQRRRGSPVPTLPGPPSQLSSLEAGTGYRGTGKGEKESKQRQAWSLRCRDCLVWLSHLLGHSRQVCRQTPTPPTTCVCACTHMHTCTHTHSCTQSDMRTHTRAYRHLCRHISHTCRHSPEAPSWSQVLGRRVSVAPSGSASLLPFPSNSH